MSIITKPKARRAPAKGRKPAASALRRRRTPGEAKSEALAYARQLLLAEGPTAITLQRVAAGVGVTHSNLLHHFGSAAELQTALMAMMVRDLTEALAAAVTHLESDQAAPRALVDIVFDAFERGGAGKLAAWLALSGHLPHLETIEASLDNLVKALQHRFAHDRAASRVGVTSAVLLVSMMAFSDALIGAPLRDMLKREPGAARNTVTFLLSLFLDPAIRAKVPR